MNMPEYYRIIEANDPGLAAQAASDLDGRAAALDSPASVQAVVRNVRREPTLQYKVRYA